MKKILCGLMVIAMLAGCSGVSQADYDAVVEERDTLQETYQEQVSQILELNTQITENELKDAFVKSVASTMGDNVIGGTIGEKYSYIIIPLENPTENSILNIYEQIITHAQAVKSLLEIKENNNSSITFSFKVLDNLNKEIFEITYHSEEETIDLSMGADYMGLVSKVISNS